MNSFLVVALSGHTANATLSRDRGVTGSGRQRRMSFGSSGQMSKAVSCLPGVGHARVFADALCQAAPKSRALIRRSYLLISLQAYG